MLWRLLPLPAGFWDGVSGTRIWPSAGFSKSTITNDELERIEYYYMRQLSNVQRGFRCDSFRKLFSIFRE